MSTSSATGSRTCRSNSPRAGSRNSSSRSRRCRHTAHPPMIRALGLLDRIVFAAIVLLMAAMVTDVAIQVIWRYVLQDPQTWTEELALYLFAWEIFLGAGLAFGRKAHIVVDVVFMALRGTARRVLVVVGDLVVLVFLLALLWQGAGMVALTSDTYS